MKKLNFFLHYTTAIFVSLGTVSPIYTTAQSLNNVSFIENKGQIGDQDDNPRPDVLFEASAGTTDFHFMKTGISYQLYKLEESQNVKFIFSSRLKKPVNTTIYRLDINWLNANKKVEIIASKAHAGYSNYYNLVAPNGISHVKTYNEILYKALYPDIDLHYYSKDANLKYDFVVSPGGDYKQIQLEVSGAEKITINKDGSVSLITPLGTLEEGAPIVYQDHKKLKARWILNGSTLAFEIEGNDRTKELIIDPLVRSWGTWYGGTGEDLLGHCATDGSGNSYITGETKSHVGSVMATVGAHQYNSGSFNGRSCFLTKFNASGTRQWGTYYGGGSADAASSCAVNDLGEVYMTGMTTTTAGSVIATPGAHQTSLAGGSYYWSDAFLVKFNSNGLRIWGTYYGGTDDEYGRSVALDNAGNVYMAGDAESTTGISTPGSQQASYGGGNSNGGDGFLVKFNSAGVRQWATYYGGSSQENLFSVDADAAGNIFIAGRTASYNSTNLASSSAHQTAFANGPFYGPYDAFIAKFNTNGVRHWGTYYGADGSDEGYECKADGNGNVYLVGATSSTSSIAIATAGAHETSLTSAALYAAILVKFNSTGVRLWGTYFGNGCYTRGYACAVNSQGDVYIGGETNVIGGTPISTPGAHQTASGGGSDGFLARFNANGMRMEATYYGGVNEQSIHGCATNTLNQVFCAGTSTASPGTGVATPNSHQANHGGNLDGFLVKFTECTTLPATPVDGTDHSVVICEVSTATLQVISTGSVNWYSTATSNSILATGSSYTTPLLSAGSHSWYASAKTCNETSSRIEIVIDIDACVSISETESTKSLMHLYPNPGNGIYCMENTEDLFIKVIDSSGLILQEERMSAGKNFLSLEKYPAGIYLIQFIGTHSLGTVKVINQ